MDCTIPIYFLFKHCPALLDNLPFVLVSSSVRLKEECAGFCLSYHIKLCSLACWPNPYIRSYWNIHKKRIDFPYLFSFYYIYLNVH